MQKTSCKISFKLLRQKKNVSFFEREREREEKLVPNKFSASFWQGKKCVADKTEKKQTPSARFWEAPASDGGGPLLIYCLQWKRVVCQKFLCQQHVHVATNRKEFSKKGQNKKLGAQQICIDVNPPNSNFMPPDFQLLPSADVKKIALAASSLLSTRIDFLNLHNI